MSETITYGFWFWSHKLNGILNLLAALSQYELDDTEIEAIRLRLEGTHDEKGEWAEYQFRGKRAQLALNLAYDAEAHKDMIHLRITASPDMKLQLETLNLFQSMVKTLDMEP